MSRDVFVPFKRGKSLYFVGNVIPVKVFKKVSQSCNASTRKSAKKMMISVNGLKIFSFKLIL